MHKYYNLKPILEKKILKCKNKWNAKFWLLCTHINEKLKCYILDILSIINFTLLWCKDNIVYFVITVLYGSIILLNNIIIYNIYQL